MPLGPKAAHTRERILDAAAGCFVDNGYQQTTVADVAAAAGVSLGTVYQYFRDRSDLVVALVRQGVADMLGRTDTTWRAEEGLEGLNRVVTNFVTSYSEAAGVSGLWEEVSHVDTDLAELRRALGRVFTRQVERELGRARRAGLVGRDIDPPVAARALTGMVDRYCYVTYVFDPPNDGSQDPLRSATELAKLWAKAVGLKI
jgi:AcrR family transcriptional regulator